MKSGKAVLIVVIFCAAIVILMIIKDQTNTDRLLHDVIFFETAEDWEKCNLENCFINSDSAAVVFDDNARSSLATFPVAPGFEFDQVILSWNIRYSENPGQFYFNLEVSEDSIRWYHFDYLSWGDSSYKESGGEKSIDGIGGVDVDVLKLQKPMKYARVMADYSGKDNDEKVFLRRLALSFSNDNPSWREYRKYHSKNDDLDYGMVKLSVPYITQRSLEANKEGGACSPTSVGMVLNYHIPGIDPDAFAWTTYDYGNEIFGNWPYNVQAAFAAGLSRTWVARHCGFDEIYDEVSNGKPVVISIKYNYDELPNSPIHSAENGHLVVVIGFDGPDSVICNDPAGHGVDDGIIKYPRKELERAWVEHTAVAYHLWP
ncbi:MAG: C39 family peptidase [Candidatus Zixiibacteriota bacterium]|nr:MAG: C39 family peptidase [candidate division Zixibacteria bacterium]